MPGEINRDNAVGEASGQRKGPGIESIASYIWCAIYRVLMLHENKPYSPGFERPLVSLKDRINEIKERSSLTKNSAIMGFLLPIAQNNKLREELEILNNLALNSIDYEGFYSQLSKVIIDFKLQSLADKIRLLGLLQEGEDFADVQRVYRNKWSLYNLMNDGDFKQTYVNKAVGELDESVGKGFREDISKYVQLVDEGKNIASRHFEENIAFQAYCKETKEANKTLNINLIHYDKSKPIRISDILQQEKDIGKLNIYCNKKRDICARRKDKKRYYEFKEGACYQMTSTWPVEDESGNISTCTMVMNVDSTGITKIVKFDGREFNDESYKKDKKLIEQNKELYIGNSSLCEAVKEFLKKQHGLGCGRENMVPIKIKKERCNSSPGVVPEGNTDSNNPTALSSANSDTSTQTGVNSRGNGVQAEITSQDNGTQTRDDQSLVKAERKIKELKVQNKKLEQKSKELEQRVEGIPDVDYLRSLIRHLGFQDALKIQELDNEQFSARRDFNKISQLQKERDLLVRLSECMKVWRV